MIKWSRRHLKDRYHSSWQTASIATWLKRFWSLAIKNIELCVTESCEVPRIERIVEFGILITKIHYDTHSRHLRKEDVWVSDMHGRYMDNGNETFTVLGLGKSEINLPTFFYMLRMHVSKLQNCGWWDNQ